MLDWATKQDLRINWDNTRYPFDVKRCRWRNHRKARQLVRRNNCNDGSNWRNVSTKPVEDLNRFRRDVSMPKCNFCNKKVEEVKLVHHMTGGVSYACTPCTQEPKNAIIHMTDSDGYYTK